MAILEQIRRNRMTKTAHLGPPNYMISYQTYWAKVAISNTDLSFKSSTLSSKDKTKNTLKKPH